PWLHHLGRLEEKASRGEELFDGGGEGEEAPPPPDEVPPDEVRRRRSPRGKASRARGVPAPPPPGVPAPVAGLPGLLAMLAGLLEAGEPVYVLVERGADRAELRVGAPPAPPFV